MPTSAQFKSAPESLRPFTVVVLCEDEVTHAHATRQCHRMALQHWREVEFRFKWWLFTNLNYPDHATSAASAAAAADMIILCTQPASAFPETVSRWLDDWTARRHRREGTLVNLSVETSDTTGGGAPFEEALRQIAHQAGLDFLPHLPRQLDPMVPDARDWLAERASQTSMLLREIVCRLPVPLPPAAL